MPALTDDMCKPQRMVTALDLSRSLYNILDMQTVSYSDARDNLKKVMDQATADRAPILITRQRGENVVLISASEWAGMEETLHLMSSPANAKRLLEAIEGLDARGGEERTLIEP